MKIIQTPSNSTSNTNSIDNSEKNNTITQDENGVWRDEKGRYASDPNKVNTTLTRPTLRAETKSSINERYKFNDDGTVTNKETGEITQPPFHYGHDYGWENRRILEAADQMGWDQKTLNDFVNDPKKQKHFSIQNANENMSHKGEKPGRGELDEILKSMKEFQNK